MWQVTLGLERQRRLDSMARPLLPAHKAPIPMFKRSSGLDMMMEEYLIATIGEILLYNTVLGQTDRQNVEGYLAARNGA
jgi:hypothetical protein